MRNWHQPVSLNDTSQDIVEIAQFTNKFNSTFIMKEHKSLCLSSGNGFSFERILINLIVRLF